MDLLTGWTGKSGYSGPDNLIRHRLPHTRVLRTPFSATVLLPVGEEYVYTSVQCWLEETITIQSYRYIGMTEATAELCEAAMVTAWTKTVNVKSVGPDGIVIGTDSTYCVADIESRPSGGLAWDTFVDVSWPSYNIIIPDLS